MKKSFISITLCALLLSGSADAIAQRNSDNRELQKSENVRKGSQNNGRHQGAGATLPGSYNSKPNNSNNNSYTRPGRQPQMQPDKQPVTPVYPVKPATPVAPAKPVVPAKPVAPVRPVRPAASVRPVRPAYRPGRPVYQPWVRPVRPVNWRPTVVVPTIRPLFGLNFGMGLNVSVNLLHNNGYSVYEYGNGTVYVNNVNELNLLWHEGILTYDNGGLARTQLYYSTPYYDVNRYNQVYSMLTSQYGVPYSTNLPGGGLQATWFGNNGGYIQLDLTSQQTYSGANKYFTTLTFGN